jgi:hypothetical protein
LLIRKSKKEKPRPPTVEEFIKLKPKRAELEWNENSEGLVEIKMPKFSSNFGKSFCKTLKKDQHFTANMDKIGSALWKECDGVKTVEDILKIIKKKFPKEKNIDQRLFLFLQQMNSLSYISLKNK